MALNKFMHPRNPYKAKKPNFKELSIKYEEFRKHAKTDLGGNVHLDFKNPACLRALSWALLKEDFDLDVTLPEDRLIPTIPLRLNYILWLEDLINKKNDIKGIDIGAGASCVYPLIGARKNGWCFLATEADPYNFNCAVKNVQDNNLSEKIKVQKVESTTTLKDLLHDSTETYEFMMCNPPFFASQLEAWGMDHTRSEDRPEASSVSTATMAESVCHGGEVAFIKQFIADSVQLRERVRIYSSMLGKKTSVKILKDELRRCQIPNFGTTEFCQGKTMRWGLAWTFDTTVTFPKPPSKAMKGTKPKPPLCFIIPPSDAAGDLEHVTNKIKGMLEEIKMEVIAKKQSNNLKKLTILAKKNTWSHQRRKRRQMEREQSPPNKRMKPDTDTEGIQDADIPCQKGENSPTDQQQSLNTPSTTSCSEPGPSSTSDHTRTEDNRELPGTKPVTENMPKLEGMSRNDEPNTTISNNSCNNQPSTEKEDNESSAKTDMSGEDHLVKCRLELLKQGNTVTLKMYWISGQQKEAMHQILQFIKNHISHQTQTGGKK